MKKMLVLIISLFLLTACADADTVATVGKTKITKGEFEFYLSSIKSQLSGTELKTDEDWQTQEIEGEKAIDVAKQRALEIAVNNAEYCELAKAQGIQLDSSEKNRIEEMKKQVIKSYGGEKAYKEFLKQNNITDSFIQMMCESTVYYEKIADRIKSENPVTEEEKEQYFEKEKAALGAEYKKAKHILFLTKDMTSGAEFSEEETAKVKELAEDIYRQIEDGADFDALMREYSEDPGLETNPGGYVFTAGQMVSEFEQAVDSVSAGEITLCKSDYGYHIIKRLSIEYGDIADNIDELVLKERVQKEIKQWEKDYNLAVTTNENLIKTIK